MVTQEPEAAEEAAQAEAGEPEAAELRGEVGAVDTVVLSADLMDRSKISGALPAAKIVRSFDALLEHSATASLVIVDLARAGEVAGLEQLVGADRRVIAFGSHVNESVLQRASEAGAEALPRSVFFRRLAAGDL